MADAKAVKDYLPRRGAARFRSMSDLDPSFKMHFHSSWVPADLADGEGSDSTGLSAGLKFPSRKHDPTKKALMSEDGGRPNTERSSFPKPMESHMVDHFSILDEDEDGGSDDSDAPTDRSLRHTSPPERSSFLDEGVVLDRSENQESPSRNDNIKVWETAWHQRHMAAVSSEKFDNLLKMCPEFHSCKSSMAAFILEREVLDTAGHPRARYVVVALGAGQSSCTEWLCYNGTVVHDCHAVTIARRALQRFLYKQLLLFFDPDPKSKKDCIFECSTAGPQLQLKAKVNLHLYTNQPPEGAAKNFYFKGSVSDICPSLKLQYHTKGLLIPAAYLEPSLWGSRVCCMTGTDKLCRWAVTGVQGALLSHFIQPLYVTSMVLGSKTHSADDVSYITNKRLGDELEDQLAPPYRKQNIFFLCGDQVGSVITSPRHDDLSINWCLGDQDIEVLDSGNGHIIDGSPSVSGPGFSSRLCKRALYSCFRRVAQLGGHSYLLELPTYHSVKTEASLYQSAKGLVSMQFQRNHAGPWNSKHLVDCFSP